MTAFEQEVIARLVRIEAKVDAIAGKPKAHLTQRAFAKLAGMSVRTVQRKIDANEIRTANGRIPWSELSRFVTAA